MFGRVKAAVLSLWASTEAHSRGVNSLATRKGSAGDDGISTISGTSRVPSKTARRAIFFRLRTPFFADRLIYGIFCTAEN
jgi:hypothetical protein